MHFTREPVVETIISPQEGHRLVIRNRARLTDGEFSVYAVQIVSFGQAYFFRNAEQPHSFLFPLAEYEVVEMKEVMAPLKKASIEKSSNKGGGRKPFIKKEGSSLVSKEPSEGLGRRSRKISQKLTNRGGGTSARGSNRIKGEERKGEEEETLPLNRPVPIVPPSTLVSETLNRLKECFASAEIVRKEGADGMVGEGEKGVVEGFRDTDHSVEPS